jgi:hypothetical protein
LLLGARAPPPALSAKREQSLAPATEGRRRLLSQPQDCAQIKESSLEHCNFSWIDYFSRCALNAGEGARVPSIGLTQTSRTDARVPSISSTQTHARARHSISLKTDLKDVAYGKPSSKRPSRCRLA